MNYTLFLQAFRTKYGSVQDKNLLLNILREELQSLLLYVIFTQTSYPLYFMGGTQLRFSYKINRFSEDIDFALAKPDVQFPSDNFFSILVKAFSEKTTGFRVHARLTTKRTVIKMLFSFAQLLYDLGLSPLPDETLKIKIELDTNPPSQARYGEKAYRSIFADYYVKIHDLETSFAGKLAAVLLREYQKGRDYYDLKWYLEQHPRIEVNFSYFNANLEQQGEKSVKNLGELIRAVIRKVKQLDLVLMRKDLERFVVMDETTFTLWLKRYIEETVRLLKAYQGSHET